MDLFKRIQNLSAIYDDDGPSSMVPESRPMFNERMQFDGGGTPLQRLRQEIVDSMKPYAPGDVTEDQLQLVVKDITLDMTPEQAQASALSNFRKLFGMADGGRAGYEDGGMLVQPNADGSRPGYKGKKFLVKTGDPKKLGNVIEQKFIEVTGSKNRPETYKKTGVKKILYKPQIIVKNKTVLTSDFGTKDAATAAVKKYREKNPIKNAPPDLKTLDKQKKKKYLDNKERTKKISKQGGVESFETGDKIIHKGHSQNIDNPNVKIKPGNIIYTPQKINQSMAGSEGKNKYTDLDYKIDEAENKIKKIKNSKASAGTKKKLLAEQDNLLMKYVAQSDGYKTVTLSNNKPYGEIFQKSKSMDMFDEFSNMTEKETKKFVNQYFTDEGKLKDKWTKGNISNVDKANIKKSYTFLENIKNAKANAKRINKVLSPKHQQLIKNQFCPGNRKGGVPGTCDISEAMDNMIKQTNAVKQGAIKGTEATRIANKASKIVRFGTGKGLGAVLGPIGLAGEAVFEIGMAVPGYARGESGKRLLGDSILGLIPGVGQSAEEEFAEYATKDGMSQLDQQKIKDVNRFLELNNSLPMALKNIGKGGRGDPLKGSKTFEKQYEEYEPLYNQFVGGPPSESASTAFAEQQRINDLINADKAIRAEQRNIAPDEDFMAAGGGIAKLAGDRSGPPPESGPNSQGLQGLFNRVKKV